MRIASLLASGTEIVYALGLGDQLVGISHECDFPSEALSKPRVSLTRFNPNGKTSAEIDEAVRNAMAQHGSVYELDEALLRRLQPDLVITQAMCAVCAVPTALAEQAVKVLDGRIEVLSLDSHSIDEVCGSIRAVGRATGVEARAESVVRELNARLAATTNAVSGTLAPRVLAIEWLDPPFVPGHWVPEMVEVAGGKIVAGKPAQPSRQVSWDSLRGLDPDVLVVMPCGYGLEQSRLEANKFAAKLQGVAGRAVSSGRAFVVDGSSYFNRSGPRMVDGVEILGALLHPERFSEYDLAGKAEVWGGYDSMRLEIGDS